MKNSLLGCQLSRGTLDPTPYLAPPPNSYALHPTPCTPQPTPYTQPPASYPLPPKPYTTSGCQLSRGAEPLWRQRPSSLPLPLSLFLPPSPSPSLALPRPPSLCSWAGGLQAILKEFERGGTTLENQLSRGVKPFWSINFQEGRNHFGVSTFERGGTTLASAAGATPIFSEKSIPISARTCTEVPFRIQGYLAHKKTPGVTGVPRP